MIPSIGSCPWIAAPNASWLTILSGGLNGCGFRHGDIHCCILNNFEGVTPETGTISIACEMFTVTQAGCTHTFSSSGASFPGEGRTNTVNVIAASSCPWAAAPDCPWLTILSGANGAGSGTVTYVVAPNDSSTPRTGYIFINYQTLFMVTQDGCPCALSRSGASFTANGGTNTVNVITRSNARGPRGDPRSRVWLTILGDASGVVPAL